MSGSDGGCVGGCSSSVSVWNCFLVFAPCVLLLKSDPPFIAARGLPSSSRMDTYRLLLLLSDNDTP